MTHYTDDVVTAILGSCAGILDLLCAVKLGLKLDKINVFNAEGSVNLTKGVVNDVR